MHIFFQYFYFFFYVFFIFIANPAVHMGYVFITPDSPLMMFWAAGLYYTFMALKYGRTKDFIISGFLVGAMMLSKYAGILFPVAVFIYNKIYKKIGINTAILAFHTGNRIDAQAILKLCEPHLENEWAHGKYRFLKLKQQLSKEEEDLPKPTNSCHMQYYCELDFEPWLVTFTHD